MILLQIMQLMYQIKEKLRNSKFSVTAKNKITRNLLNVLANIWVKLFFVVYKFYKI